MKKQYLIPVSMCDNLKKLSIPNIFSLFMDIAAEDAMQIGLGPDDLGENLFWLTVKTKIRFYERPEAMKTVTLDTWPQKPVRVRCNRFYRILEENKVFAEGKTEWAMLDVAAKKLLKADDFYPKNLVHREDTVCDEPFARISEDFSDGKEIFKYTVRSTDIDAGQHMNNAAYIRAVFGGFTCEYLNSIDIKEVEIAFKTPCYEGEKLSVLRRDTDFGFELGIKKEDGQTASVMRFVL